MDDLYQLKQDMTMKELRKFDRDRMKEEKRTEEISGYLELNREIILKKERKEHGGNTKVRDMPRQNVDEKESTRRKREKAQMKAQIELVEKKRKNAKMDVGERIQNMWEAKAMDQEGIAFFSDTLDVTMLTPRYVLENFSEIREKLDVWKEQISLFASGGAADDFMPFALQFRLEQMNELYRKGEAALQSALGALGYRYDPKQKGEKQLVNDVTQEEKQQMLQQNRQQREDIAQYQQQMDEKTVQEMMEHKAKYDLLDESEPLLRKEMAKKPEYAFIRSEYFNRKEQYDTIKEVKELFDRYPQEYEEKKEWLNRLYQEIYNLMQADAGYQKELAELEAAEAWSSEYSMKAVSRCIEKRKRLQQIEIARISRRTDAMKEGIRVLLIGGELKESDRLLLKDYLPETYAGNSREMEIPAGEYVRQYQEKRAVFETLAEQLYGERAEELISGNAGWYMMLMKSGDQKHNEAVVRSLVSLKAYQTMMRAGGKEAENADREMGRVVKPLILPYLERIMAYDTKDLEHCTPEELIAKNAELQEFALFGMQITDMGKYKDPDDAQGRSIKDAFCNGKKALFQLKCSVLRSYADQARALSMIKAYIAGNLDESCFLLQELNTKMKKNPDGTVRADEMFAFAKRLLERAMRFQDAAYEKYFRADENKAFYAGVRESNPASAHPEYEKELKEFFAMSNGKLREEYHRYAALLKQKKDGTRAESDEGEALEPAELRRRMEMIQIAFGLTKERYKRVGDPVSLLKEPLFRSYVSVENLQSFRSMGEQEFRQMCVQLSAGMLETDQDQPERFEHYYAENMKGLQTYKKHMAQHYEMLEEKFHHRLPSAEYIAEHQEELERLFGNVQVDHHMVEGLRDLLDLTKPEDIRLFHLLQVYDVFGMHIGTLGVSVSSLDNTSYRDACNPTDALLRKMQESVHYLDEHPSPETVIEGPETEEEAKMEQQIEKFRKIGEDTAHILTASKEEQAKYLQRVEELQNYIREHEEDTSLTMRQFKGWLEMAHSRIALFEKK